MSQSLFINPTALEAGLEAAFAARSTTNEHQATAFDRFAKLGFPNRRVEGWRWSDFNAVLRQLAPTSEPSDAGVIAPSAFAALDPLEIQVVNGRIVLPEDKCPEGVRFGIIESVGTIPELENHPIASLNVGMTRKAIGIEVLEGVAFERPILIRHINTGAGISFAQSLTRIGPNASASVIETYEGEGTGLYSHLYHLVLRDGAKLQRYVHQDTGADSVVHSICAAKLEKAEFKQSSLSTGGRLARHETHAHFWVDGAAAEINSAALIADDRHGDFTSHVIHKAADCETRQLHKGVAAGRGRTVFQGKFEVERAAQKTDAKMAANALLLSDMAEANHKPELEIYADDVECAHGSTAGALDDDALFYLRQRGLDEAAARSLLVEAFVGEALDNIENEGVRDVLAARVRDWLEAL